MDDMKEYTEFLKTKSQEFKDGKIDVFRILDIIYEAYLLGYNAHARMVQEAFQYNKG